MSFFSNHCPSGVAVEEWTFGLWYAMAEIVGNGGSLRDQLAMLEQGFASDDTDTEVLQTTRWVPLCAFSLYAWARRRMVPLIAGIFASK